MDKADDLLVPLWTPAREREITRREKGGHGGKCALKQPQVGVPRYYYTTAMATHRFAIITGIHEEGYLRCVYM
jgi:hypothetical protein